MPTKSTPRAARARGGIIGEEVSKRARNDLKCIAFDAFGDPPLASPIAAQGIASAETFATPIVGYSGLYGTPLAGGERRPQPIGFMLGHNWPIGLICNDPYGDPIDITGANVRLRIGDRNGRLRLESNTLSGGIVACDAKAGLCHALVTEAMQSNAGFARGAYFYEFRLEQPNGSAGSQAYGTGATDKGYIVTFVFGFPLYERPRRPHHNKHRTTRH
jgi:hypothetical protein